MTAYTLPAAAASAAISASSRSLWIVLRVNLAAHKGPLSQAFVL